MNRHIGMVCLLGMASALNASSEPPYEQAYIDENRELPGAFAPTKVVKPKLRSVPENLKVDVLLSVDAKGKVVDAEILRSTDARHDAAIVTAAKRWKFRPVIKEGKPAPSQALVPFVARGVAETLAMK